MNCCREMSIEVAPGCTTQMVVDSTTNASQNYPAVSGIPPWDFGSTIASGFPTPSLGSISLTFTSATLKTWTFGGGKFNTGMTIVDGWQVAAFSVAPTILIDGSPVTLVDTIIDGIHFWQISGANTFQTDGCVPVTVVVTGTSPYGGLGDNACLIQIQDLTP